MPPPEVAQATITLATIQAQQQAGSHQFKLTELCEFDSDVMLHARNLTLTKRSIYAAGKRVASLPSNEAKITTTPRQGHVVATWLEGNQLRVRNLSTGIDVSADVRGEKLMLSYGRIYLKAGVSLLELMFIELPSKLLVTAKLVGNVLPNATQLLDGVAIQNLLGTYFASFFSASGVCHQARLAELDGYQIIDAKAQRNVLMVIGAKKGTYDKFIYRFAENFDEYDVRIIHDVTLTDLKFVVLDSGVCLHLNDRDELEVFAQHKDAAGLKVIADPAIGGDDTLFHDGLQALIGRGKRLYRIAMRQP